MLAGLDEVPWAELEHNYGPAADVPELLRGISDPDRCEQALDELDSAIYHQGGWVCSAATAAVPFLVALAAEPTTGCRDGIIGLLGKLASEARTVEPRWVDTGWPGAWAAALPRLLALLDDPDPAVRGAVVGALSPVVDPAVDVAAALRARWEGEADASVRLRLVLAVGELAHAEAHHNQGAGAGGELAWLGGLAGHPEVPVRVAAMVASGRPASDRDAAARTTAIIDALREPASSSWAGVASVWHDVPGLIGWVGRELDGDLDAQVRLVVGLLAHADRDRRQGAARAAAEVLSRWRSPAVRLLPLLAERLTDADVAVRALAAHLLAAVGPPAAPYADPLAALLSDEAAIPVPGGCTVADIALWGLARLGDPRCVPGLAERLTGPRLGFDLVPAHIPRDIYWMALPGIYEVLALVPMHAAALLPGVRHRLRTAETLEMRRAMARAAAAWGAAAAPAVPELRSLLDGDAAQWGAEALAAIGPVAAETSGMLRRLAQRQRGDSHTRLAAAAALARVGGDAGVAAGVLGPELRTPLAATAARYLSALGAVGAAYVDVLRDLLADPDDWTRFEAAHALWQTTGDPTEAVPVLVRTVEERISGHTAYPVAQASVRCLAAMGTPAVTLAIPRLREILADDRRLAYFGGWRAFAEDEELRRHAAAVVAGSAD